MAFKCRKIPAELKLMVTALLKLKVTVEPLGEGDPKSKCKEVSRTKTQLNLQRN